MYTLNGSRYLRRGIAVHQGSGYRRSIPVAGERVAALDDSFGIEMVPVGAHELSAALDAYRAYGKGRHRANLNFDDCFAHAYAKTKDARLLYKGDDFSHTVLA